MIFIFELYNSHNLRILNNVYLFKTSTYKRRNNLDNEHHREMCYLLAWLAYSEILNVVHAHEQEWL